MNTVSLDLKKGVSLNLTKEFSNLTKINLGLGWQTEKDLDAFAIMLDENKKVLATTYYGSLNNLGVRLSGDDLVGGKVGDCETIFVDLNNLSPKVKKICLFANIYNAGCSTFGEIKGSYIRLIDANTNRELAKYNLTERPNFNAIHFADLDVNNDGLTFTTIGEGLNGSISEIRDKIAGKSKKGFFERLFG